MFKNLTQFAGLLRNAGQMTQKVQEAKVKLGKTTFERKSISTNVTIAMNGLGQVQRVEIAAEAVLSHRREELEKEVMEAVNAGIKEARVLHLAAIKNLTNGLDIPMMDKLLAELAE